MAVASLTDYVWGGVFVGVSASMGSLLLIAGDIHWPEVMGGGRLRRVPAVLRGLALAVPLVVMFGALLMSADATFERLARAIIWVDLGDVVVHASVIGMVAWVVAGWGRQLIVEDPWGNPASQMGSPFGLGLVEIGMVLGAIDLLFLSFVVVQVGYLFGGSAFVDASREFTYSEYARRGFFELVALAGLSLPLLLILHWLARPSSVGEQAAFIALAGAFVALLFVIMASALVRMALYTSLYGLTELRLYTTAFMGWLGVVLLWFTGTVLRGERRRFAVGALLAGFLAIWTLDVLNPDALIAGNNLQRINAPQPVDGRYLGSLSADAVPTLVAALPSLPAAERRKLSATLTSRWSSPASDWRTWNWSRTEANGLVTDAQLSCSRFNENSTFNETVAQPRHCEYTDNTSPSRQHTAHVCQYEEEQAC